MQNIIYEKTLEKNREMGTEHKVVLTKEVNGFIVWQILWEGEDEKRSVLANFSDHPMYQNTAIEFVIDFAMKYEKDKNSALVQRLLRLLNRREWNADLLDQFTAEFRQAGYVVLDFNDEEGSDGKET